MLTVFLSHSLSKFMNLSRSRKLSLSEYECRIERYQNKKEKKKHL